jgi:SAM-dependent methyltransferase
MPWQEVGYLRWFPSLTWQCAPQIDSVLQRLRRGARVVDLGAGGRLLDQRHIRLDFVRCPHTSVLADAQRLPFSRASIDLVIATGLLEHVERADLVLDEIRRVLRPGGYVHIEVPFLQQYHNDPIDYRRYTIDGLEAELLRRGFSTVGKGAHIGPTVTMLTLAGHYALLLFQGRSMPSKIVGTAVFFGWSVLTWPLKFIDRWLITRPAAHGLAFGIYCTGQTPEYSDAR